MATNKYEQTFFSEGSQTLRDDTDKGCSLNLHSQRYLKQNWWDPRQCAVGDFSVDMRIDRQSPKVSSYLSHSMMW